MVNTFVAFDGEGIGEAHHEYVLLANSLGQTIKAEKGKFISWEEALPMFTQEKLLHTRNVWFAGNYDINMLGKHESEKFQRELYINGQAEYLANDGTKYFLKYIPRKILKIRKGDSKKTWMMYDVWGFFQASFEKALEQWKITSDALIKEGKAKRAVFSYDDMEFMVQYNAMECRLLVQLMDALESKLVQVGVQLHDYHGAGAIAARFLNDVKLRQHLPKKVTKEVHDARMTAYFGGRVELLKRGEYTHVYSGDINSAYPTAMLSWPSLVNKHWSNVSGSSLTTDDFAMVHIKWRLDPTNSIGILPYRCHDDYVVFPNAGEGIYHNVEVQAALRYISKWHISGSMTLGKALLLDKPYSFPLREYIIERAKQRLAYKKADDFAHIPLKLGLNSLYGKVAQRPQFAGHKPFFRELIGAGYITAYTRAKLLDSADPDNTIMFATDSIKSLAPIPNLHIGTALGEWETDDWSKAVFVLAGVYGYQDKKKWHDKTRGFKALDVNEVFKRIGKGEIIGGHDKQFMGIKRHLAQYKAYPEPCRFYEITKEIDWDNNAKRDFVGGNSQSIPSTYKVSGPSKAYSPRFSQDDEQITDYEEN